MSIKNKPADPPGWNKPYPKWLADEDKAEIDAYMKEWEADVLSHMLAYEAAEGGGQAEKYSAAFPDELARHSKERLRKDGISPN